MTDEVAAGMIELRGEGAGDVAGLFAQLICGVLDGLFRMTLHLCLGFFLVPRHGFEKFLHHLVF